MSLAEPRFPRALRRAGPLDVSRHAARTQPKNPHGLVLYDYGGSPCARRVRITLVEKGLEWIG